MRDPGMRILMAPKLRNPHSVTLPISVCSCGKSCVHQETDEPSENCKVLQTIDVGYSSNVSQLVAEASTLK